MTTQPPINEPSAPRPGEPMPTAQPIATAHPASAVPPPWWAQPPKKRSWFRRILTGIGILIFIFSILMNFGLLMVLALVAPGPSELRATVLEEGQKDQTVAVFAIEGTIDGKTSADFRKFYRQVRDDKNVKAVVLRVDSPGGTVSDSDEIHHLVVMIQKELGRPVIVSMGGMAASGGYYVSASADQIFVEPTTVTGSIGVIAGWPVIKDFLNSHGVQMVMLRSEQARGTKATENPFEKPTDRTIQNMEKLLTDMHKQFADVVRAGRPNLKTKNIQVQIDVPTADGSKKETIQQTEPLNGQVYLGQDAIDNGLADQKGYTADAIAYAAKTANLSKPHVVQYVRPRGLMAIFEAKAEATTIPDPVKVLDDLSTPRVMMMWKVEN